MFGKSRLQDIIRQHADQSAEFIQTEVIDALRDFQGDAPQEDDITMLALQRNEI